MKTALLILASSLTLLLGDSFELVRVGQMGSYKVAHSVVRVLNANKATIAESRTDQYGRVKFDLPNGTYDAEVVDGRTKYKFQITIPATDRLTRIELK